MEIWYILRTFKKKSSAKPVSWRRQQSDCANRKDFCYLPNRERKLVQWENSSQVPESLFKMRHKLVSQMGYFWRFTQSLEGLYSTYHKGFWSMTTAPEHYIKVTTVSIRLDKRLRQGLHLPQAQRLAVPASQIIYWKKHAATSLQVRQCQERFSICFHMA